MKLKIAHISDLCDFYFNIPNYQRGYRWETKQIHELLDDLLEFRVKQNAKSSGVQLNNEQFYCLQPLVVTENKCLSVDENHPVFDVIDGQQRLTTIYLIMQFLDMETFHIRYERACRRDLDITNYDNGQLDYAQLRNLSIEEISKIPDYFYLTQALRDIAEWFEHQKNTYPKIKRLIEDILENPDYKRTASRFYDNLEDENKALLDVRFIWYDASLDGNLNYKNSIAVFKSLNYGKTPLTAAELIKALLFQCDIYDEMQRPEMKQVAFRMSTEWDSIEKKLQDELMWGMLMPYANYRSSHIDIVLSFVARRLKENYKIKTKALEEDRDYDYHIFNGYLKDANTFEGNEHKSFKEIIVDLWNEIQDVFGIFQSWYEDRCLYHLVGLYFLLNNKKGIAHLDVLRELYNLYRTKDRHEFIKILKEEKIGKIISLRNLHHDANGAIFTLNDIYYGDYSKEIQNILLVYNVDIAMKSGQNQHRFPFGYYQKITPSLEHVHPQHMHDESIDFLTRCRWYKDKCSELEMMDIDDDHLKDAVKNLRDVLYLTKEEEASVKSEETKKSIRKKEETYKSNEAAYLEWLNVIDDYFDELADIDERELHHISNMALVDKITNTRLGNGLLDTKRSILKRLADVYNRSKGEEGAYTFAGTWRVFNKDFDNRSDDKSLQLKATNLRFWTKLDRVNYFIDLEKTYNEYVR